jgi:hypothetical protein
MKCNPRASTSMSFAHKINLWNFPESSHSIKVNYKKIDQTSNLF